MFSLTQNYLTRGFWGDEAWTSLISQLPYLQMLKTTAADFHPPAYYTVVELWYKIFPPTEVSTRLISVIFYLLTGFLVYKLVYFIEVFKEEVESSGATLEVIRKRRFWGLLSAFVVLANPIFFTYAFEARNYTMFAFAAVGSMYSLVKLLSVLSSHPSTSLRMTLSLSKGQLSDGSQSVGQSTSRETKGQRDNVLEDTEELKTGKPKTDNWKWSFLFVLFSTLGIYTHYYMFFTLAAQGLYLLIFERKTLFSMIAVYFVIGMLYLPWIPFLFSQVTSVGESYWIGGIDKRTHYEAILRILGGEQQHVFRTILFWLSIVLVLTGLVQHIRPVRQRLEPQALSGGQKSFEKPYILIWLWAVVPFILATLPGFKIGEFKLPFRPIFFWRYLIPAAVPVSLVIVHAAAKLPDYLFKGTIAMLIILSLAIDYLTLTRYPTTFRQVYASQVVSQIKPEDKIVTVLPSFAEVLYYRNRFGLGNELIVLPEGLIQHSGKSLLDAYVENGVVKIDDRPESDLFELRPGQTVVKSE